MPQINTKFLIGLSIAVSIVLIAAISLTLTRQPNSENNETTVYLFPELHNNINVISAIKLFTAEEKPLLSILNTSKGWVIAEKANYPANQAKIKGFLLSLSDSRLVEAKTNNPQRYADLGVEDIKSKEAKGLLIQLDGLSKPQQLILGNQNSKGQGYFVRNPDNVQSWLSSGQFNVERDPVKWLDTQLLDFKADSIARIELSKSNNNGLQLVKQQASDKDFKILNPPAGKELDTVVVINQIANTLTNFYFEDVVSQKELSMPDQSKTLQAYYRRFDGLTINITAWEQDSKFYALLEASFDQSQFDANIQFEQAAAKTAFEAAQANAAKPAEQGEATKRVDPVPQAPLAVTDPEKYKQQRQDQLNTELETYQKRFAGWYYIIPAFKYGKMDKSIADLIKPAPSASVAPVAAPKPAAAKSIK